MFSNKPIDIENPRYDQSTFTGRARHFFAVTNPLNILATERELDYAKYVVDSFRSGKTLEDLNITEDQLWKAKQLYDSAFHCQTGEKLIVPGRMAFQMPGNMLIGGMMMTFYKTAPAVILWQTVNQGYNAIVNYSNRNASASVTTEQLAGASVAATAAGVLTALGFNKVIQSSPALSSGIVGRFVPLFAVAAANCVNIPLMRQQELKNGINVETENGKVLGPSSNAAQSALMQVVPSRVAMAAPGMMIPPIIMSKLEKTPTFIKNPWLKAPATVMICGVCLVFSTPLCCALFPQKAAIHVKDLEPALQREAEAKFPGNSVFYFNKGL